MSLSCERNRTAMMIHDYVIKWQHFPRYWPFYAGNSPVTGEFPSQSQWRGALMSSLICAQINDWVNNREAGDLRRHRAHYDVSVMVSIVSWLISNMLVLNMRQTIIWTNVGYVPWRHIALPAAHELIALVHLFYNTQCIYIYIYVYIYIYMYIYTLT